MPAFVERDDGVFDLGARQAVDDAGVAGVPLGDEILQLRLGVLLLDDLVADVGTIEAGDETRRTIQAQSGRDLVAGEVVGGGGQRDPRHVGKLLGQRRQSDIFRPEVMAPLRDAVRLVDREQGELRPFQQRQTARRQQPFRGDVEQVEVACDEALFDRLRFVPRERRVQHRGLDAGFEQPGDLVAHQRDQRRDDDAAARAQQRRQLVAKRLAAAGRHQHQAIAAAGDVIDDRLLLAAEGGQAENRVQEGDGGGGDTIIHG